MADEENNNSTNTKSNRRKNGFETPFDILQICTWFIYPIIITHYFAFIFFLLWDYLAVRVVLTVLFSMFATGTFLSVYLTCSIDPADDALCNASSVRSTASNDQIYCYFCEINVHNSSKHCRFCDKCVTRFDHHCKWLNTCIGEKNYRYFLMTIAFVFFLTLENLVLSIALMIESFAYPDSFHDRVNDKSYAKNHLGSPLSIEALQALLVVSVVILLAIQFMILQLATFHMMLVYKNITTYEYIVQQQKSEREQELQKLQEESEKRRKQAERDLQLVNMANQAARANSEKIATKHPEENKSDNVSADRETIVPAAGNEAQSATGYQPIARSNDDETEHQQAAQQQLVDASELVQTV